MPLCALDVEEEYPAYSIFILEDDDKINAPYYQTIVLTQEQYSKCKEHERAIAEAKEKNKIYLMSLGFELKA